MYTIVWTAEAERRLTRLWLASRTRHAIRNAADQIDAALQSRPHECGESRDAGMRIALASPLGVLFEIDEHQRRVRVLSVWDF